MKFFSSKKENIKEVPRRDVPIVTFQDQDLQVRIGLWSEVLRSKKAREMSNIDFYRYDNEKNGYNRLSIPKELLDDVAEEFGSILLGIGVPKNEQCHLDQFNMKDFSFRCHLKEADRDAKISLRWGDPIDDLARITFEDQNKTATYEYLNFNDERTNLLTLQHYTVKDNNHVYSRNYSHYQGYFSVSNGNYTLKIKIKKPEGLCEGYSEEPFILPNEDSLQQYLLSLPFPTDISEVYKKVREMIGNVTQYPGVAIEIVKGTDKDHLTVTDQILLEDGALHQFTMTKDGRTISLDGDGKWSYNSPKIAVDHEEDGSIRYQLKMDSYEELAENLLANHYDIVQEDVNNIQQYVKSLFANKN